MNPYLALRTDRIDDSQLHSSLATDKVLDSIYQQNFYGAEADNAANDGTLINGAIRQQYVIDKMGMKTNTARLM